MTRYFSKTTQAGWKRRRQLKSESAIVPAGYDRPLPTMGDEFEAERRQAVRSLSLEADFLTPLFQSLAVAGFAVVILVAGTLLFGWLNWRINIFVSLVAGGLWFVGTLLANRKLLWQIERIASIDLDGDGEIGEPESRSLEPVEVIHKSDNGNLQSMYRLDLPEVSDADLATFAQGILAGKSLAESTWIGKGNLFSKAQHGSLIAELERANLVQWVNSGAKSQGRKLTEQGLSAFQQWAN